MDRFVIISPCFNEEQAISAFLAELESVIKSTSYAFTIIIVDDCSTDKTLDVLENFRFRSGNIELNIITLKFNIGHQEAIGHGLRAAAKIDALGYIVIDSDGEDNPEAIKTLVLMKDFDIVFVTRGRREQTLMFKTGYLLYQLLFMIISGTRINYGNYSMISKKVVGIIAAKNFDHYSACLSKLKYPKRSVRFDRRARIGGESKMNYNSLIMHGLWSLIEYAHELLFFFIRVLFGIFLGSVLFGGYVVYGKFISHTAIPGWASTMVLGLINAGLITSGIIVLGLLILSQKNNNRREPGSF